MKAYRNNTKVKYAISSNFKHHMEFNSCVILWQFLIIGAFSYDILPLNESDFLVAFNLETVSTSKQE